LPNILAAQAMFPVANRREMRGDPGDRDVFGQVNELAQLGDTEYVAIWRAVMARLLAIPEYAAMFAAAFRGVPAGQLGFEHAATALAAFQMQALTRTRSPFDRYLEREDEALTGTEKRGALLFFQKARCSNCHNGPLLGGNQFANVGSPQVGPGSGKAAPLDKGVGEALDQPFYEFAFRVPPLRNVELTGPYMHAGAYATLEAVVRHYNNVDSATRFYDVSQLAPALRDSYHGAHSTISAVLATLDHRIREPIGLTTEEQSDLVAFLKALTDPAARDLSGMMPSRVPSGLPVN
jgi:cytochrome c peroxidase